MIHGSIVIVVLYTNVFINYKSAFISFVDVDATTNLIVSSHVVIIHITVDIIVFDAAYGIKIAINGAVFVSIANGFLAIIYFNVILRAIDFVVFCANIIITVESVVLGVVVSVFGVSVSFLGVIVSILGIVISNVIGVIVGVAGVVVSIVGVVISVSSAVISISFTFTPDYVCLCGVVCIIVALDFFLGEINDIYHVKFSVC